MGTEENTHWYSGRDFNLRMGSAKNVVETRLGYGLGKRARRCGGNDGVGEVRDRCGNLDLCLGLWGDEAQVTTTPRRRRVPRWYLQRGNRELKARKYC